MKKLFFTLVLLILAVSYSTGQGLENFNNYVGTSGTYSDGTFVGQDGSTWSYTQCRSDRAIAAPTPCMGKNRTPPANIVSGTLHNGCGTISFDYKQGFSTAVNLNVLINNVVVGNVTSPGGTGDTSNVHNSGPILVNVGGDFVIKFEQANNSTSGQVSVDNVTWTANSGGVLPEPSEYPTNFHGTPMNFKIQLNWNDAGGTQEPTAYLVLASIQNNITSPVDGVPVMDDPDMSDGSGALNIMQGVEGCSFTGLASNQTYYFKIFPYTNSGTDINYKTDGTPPATQSTTPNTYVIASNNFNTYSLAPWTQYSVTGAEIWAIDSIHGVGGTPCAKMSGYSGGPLDNEDWLISPSIDFTGYINMLLNFYSAMNYTGPALEVKVSTDYDGTGNPNSFTWNNLTATWSPGGWVWTPSGDVDLSAYPGNGIYVAFKYTSNTTASSTWELDDILILGQVPVGINDQSGKSTGFTLYPNPSRGMVTLLTGSDIPKEISVLTVLGSVIYTTTTDAKQVTLDLTKLQKGVYFVQVAGQGGKDSPVKKLIIQ